MQWNVNYLESPVLDFLYSWPFPDGPVITSGQDITINWLSGRKYATDISQFDLPQQNHHQTQTRTPGPSRIGSFWTNIKQCQVQMKAQSEWTQGIFLIDDCSPLHPQKDCVNIMTGTVHRLAWSDLWLAACFIFNTSCFISFKYVQNQANDFKMQPKEKLHVSSQKEFLLDCWWYSGWSSKWQYANTLKSLYPITFLTFNLYLIWLQVQVLCNHYSSAQCAWSYSTFCSSGLQEITWFLLPNFIKRLWDLQPPFTKDILGLILSHTWPNIISSANCMQCEECFHTYPSPNGMTQWQPVVSNPHSLNPVFWLSPISLSTLLWEESAVNCQVLTHWASQPGDNWSFAHNSLRISTQTTLSQLGA